MRRDLSDQRSAEAKERQTARQSRTDEQQLARLESAGHGNCKEAVRLREAIAAQADVKAEAAVAQATKKEKNGKGKNAKGKKARKESRKAAQK